MYIIYLQRIFACSPMPVVVFCNNVFPMDISSSIHHGFDVEIPRGKFFRISSNLQSKSTSKLWHRLNVVNSTFNIIEISISSPSRFFYIVSVLNRRNFCILRRNFFDVTSVIFLKITITKTKIIMSIFVNKNYIYLLQNNTNQTFWCKCLHVQTIFYLLQNNTKQKIIGFQNTMLITSWINFH